MPDRADDARAASIAILPRVVDPTEFDELIARLPRFIRSSERYRLRVFAAQNVVLGSRLRGDSLPDLPLRVDVVRESDAVVSEEWLAGVSTVLIAGPTDLAPLRQVLGARDVLSLVSHQVDVRGGGPKTRGAASRLLVIDSTRVGGLSATGQLKRSLLRGWPELDFMQIHGPERGSYRIARSLDPEPDEEASIDQALQAIEAFEPDTVYYRPILDSDFGLHEIAMAALQAHRPRLVTHIMDDWPERLAARDPQRGAEADRELRSVLDRSDVALSISEKMSRALGDRYGVSFEPMANGVDPAFWRSRRTTSPARSRSRETVLRYCGGLARDMTFDTVLEIARAVDSLRDEVRVRFEIYTMPWWKAEFASAAAGLRGVELRESVPDDEYPDLLTGADLLVLGYNFDQDSLRYVNLSMPNKLPEYLASGTPVLAVGPIEANGIEFLESRRLALSVTQRDRAEIRELIREAALEPARAQAIADRAQVWAFEHLDIGRTAARFQQLLRPPARTTEAGSEARS